MSADYSERPPSYVDSANDVNAVLQPTIHILAGQTIHAESADAPLLYKLNRGIATLSHATPKVELQRVERTVKNDYNNEPTIRERTRHIYDIQHIKGVLGTLSSLPSDSPPFYVEAQSRKRSLGNLALKKSRVPGRASWKALPVDLSGRSSKWNMPAFVKDAKPLFEVKQKAGRYEWSDGDGNPIAVEDEGEGQHRLVVTASLHRETMDAIVALWCCRLWQYSAEHQEPIYSGMEDVKHKFAMTKELRGSTKFGIY